MPFKIYQLLICSIWGEMACFQSYDFFFFFFKFPDCPELITDVPGDTFAYKPSGTGQLDQWAGSGKVPMFNCFALSVNFLSYSLRWWCLEEHLTQQEGLLQATLSSHHCLVLICEGDHIKYKRRDPPFIPALF